MKKLLLIDNYDSFTYNLKQLIMSNFDGIVDVKRNDEIQPDYLDKNKYNALVVSPGPKKPSDSGISVEIIKKYYKIKPIFGVCLGMQCINEVFGGTTIKSPLPIHGKTTGIIHKGSKLFKNLPAKFEAARYHSLIIKTAGDELIITAETGDKIPMAIEHKKFPVFGVQFHPESFMTEHGNLLIRNFLEYLK